MTLLSAQLTLLQFMFVCRHKELRETVYGPDVQMFPPTESSA